MTRTRRKFSTVVAALSLGLVALLPLTAPAATGSSPTYFVPTVPADMADVDMYLMTGGVGHEVNDRFGHTAIRVVNREEGTDVAYNWGKFSFEDPGFLWKFFRGQLNYSMAVRNFRSDVSIYMRMGRRVVMDHLNLTSAQKRQLLTLIAANAVPEHRVFSYQYWYKNCATIPRDDLDQVLGGQLKAVLAATPAHHVFRDYVRSNLAYSPFVVPVLDVLMNSNIDRPISAWEDMFLPANLRGWLLKTPAYSDDGKPIPGKMLLEGAELLLDNEEVWTPLFNDFLVAWGPLLIGLAVAALLFAAARFTEAAAAKRWAYRALGLGVAWWGLIGGLFGLVLLINWGFSGHPDGWHNINLMVFWPLDMVFLPLGIQLMRRAAPVRGRGLWHRYGRLYCGLHLASIALLAVLTAAQVSTQNVWQVLAWCGLPAGVMLLLVAVLGLEVPRTSSELAPVGDQDGLLRPAKLGKLGTSAEL